MRLAVFLEIGKELIIAEAVVFARTLTPLSDAEESTIRNHLPDVLHVIALDLQTEQSSAASIVKSHGLAPRAEDRTHADDHGLQRARAGLSIEQVLAEYRALRASVLRLWAAKSKPAPEDIQDIGRFNEAIDQAISESIRSHVIETERRRQLFLAALGHDLRGPLHAIALASAAIQFKASPELQTFTNVLSKSASRTSKLLESLLEYNLVGLGARMRLSMSLIDLKSQWEEETQILCAANPDARIEFEAVGDCIGSFDASRLREALGNLVTNAVRHGRQSDTVRIDVQGSHDAVTLAVTNGIDSEIPQAELMLLFEPMRRQSRKVVGEERGSLGLGLFITKEIVDAHAGTITAVCHDGLITFTLKFPKAQ